MSSQNPRVSIGLPVYNGERFFAEALDSILAQTYDDWELIISDNASTDRTAEICQAHAARDKRIRYYRNETNMGAAKNYSRVFQLSSGEYFKWLPADDLIAPEYLERCVEALDREPTAVLAYPWVEVIDENGEAFPDPKPDGQHIDWASGAADRFRQLVDESHWEMQFVFGLIRSSVLRRTRLIGSFLASECNLMAELILMGKFCEVPHHLAFYRRHPDASWPPRSKKQLQEFYDPAVEGRIGPLFFERRGYFEYYALILRSRLRPSEKIALIAYNTGRPLGRLRKALVR